MDFSNQASFGLAFRPSVGLTRLSSQPVEVFDIQRVQLRQADQDRTRKLQAAAAAAAEPSNRPLVEPRAETVNVESLLEGIYASKNPHQATSILIGSIERLFRRGAWPQVDHILLTLDLERVNPMVVLGALTITWHGRKNLSGRNDFLARAETC